LKAADSRLQFKIQGANFAPLRSPLKSPWRERGEPKKHDLVVAEGAEIVANDRRIGWAVLSLAVW
jgi:hypothetical protein